jgi:hypothetical protein
VWKKENNMFNIDEFDFILERVKIIMRNHNIDMVSAIKRIADPDYEDFVRFTKSEKSEEEFYALLGA